MNKWYTLSLMIYMPLHGMIKETESIINLTTKPITKNSFNTIIKRQITESCQELVKVANDHNLFIDQGVLQEYLKTVNRKLDDGMLIARYGLAKLYSDFDIEEVLENKKTITLANDLYDHISHKTLLQEILKKACNETYINNSMDPCANTSCVTSKLCPKCKLVVTQNIWSQYHSHYKNYLIKELEHLNVPLELHTNLLGYIALNTSINIIKWGPLIQAATLVLFYGRQIEHNIRYEQ